MARVTPLDGTVFAKDAGPITERFLNQIIVINCSPEWADDRLNLLGELWCGFLRGAGFEFLSDKPTLCRG
ncbi:hypothetical protein HAPAU_35480 [Halalkalicoccus paucihalophilus]|uniref:Uncharacterized protein n=1 Tax=Halalkalicoccus paucihalophilus TaxID=1008153 RepID=A0A151AAA1_9EURY|nr:hypothetical protein HAPAU_35480 [Halalkalicoccus paucihalophilus]